MLNKSVWGFQQVELLVSDTPAEFWAQINSCNVHSAIVLWEWNALIESLLSYSKEASTQPFWYQLPRLLPQIWDWCTSQDASIVHRKQFIELYSHKDFRRGAKSLYQMMWIDMLMYISSDHIISTSMHTFVQCSVCLIPCIFNVKWFWVLLCCDPNSYLYIQILRQVWQIIWSQNSVPRTTSGDNHHGFEARQFWKSIILILVCSAHNVIYSFHVGPTTKCPLLVLWCGFLPISSRTLQTKNCKHGQYDKYEAHTSQPQESPLEKLRGVCETLQQAYFVRNKSPMQWFIHLRFFLLHMIFKPLGYHSTGVLVIMRIGITLQVWSVRSTRQT